MNYDIVKNYAMKCRLYPNNVQKQAIDDALTGIRVFHNCLVYDMWNNLTNVKEKKKTGSDENEFVHFPDIERALKADYKNRLIKEHPIIQKCPQSALSTNVGLKADLKKEFGKKPIELQEPRYYNDLHPRLSYTYQETLSKIHFEPGVDGKSPYAFRINLSLIGSVKVRGWNQKIRFGDEDTNFLAWCQNNPKENITVIVSRDKVGDYYICFKIKECLKPFAEKPDNEIGVDVGIKDIAICSNGQKFENKKYKKNEKRHQKLLNRKLSRRWGPSNEVFRQEAKKVRAERKKRLAAGEPEECLPPPVIPSKRYFKAQKQHARLNRDITRKRDLWNHEISRKIVETSGFIGIETLNIRGMLRNKHLRFALTDAGFGSLLSDIQYKAEWHKRMVCEINQWTPSSKQCSSCKYIYNSKDPYGLKPWNLSIRSWTCPKCKTKHDRDVNAAKNILFFAKQQTLN